MRRPQLKTCLRPRLRRRLQHQDLNNPETPIPHIRHPRLHEKRIHQRQEHHVICHVHRFAKERTKLRPRRIRHNPVVTATSREKVPTQINLHPIASRHRLDERHLPRARLQPPARRLKMPHNLPRQLRRRINPIIPTPRRQRSSNVAHKPKSSVNRLESTPATRPLNFMARVGNSCSSSARKSRQSRAVRFAAPRDRFRSLFDFVAIDFVFLNRQLHHLQNRFRRCSHTKLLFQVARVASNRVGLQPEHRRRFVVLQPIRQ